MEADAELYRLVGREHHSVLNACTPQPFDRAVHSWSRSMRSYCSTCRREPHRDKSGADLSCTDEHTTHAKRLAPRASDPPYPPIIHRAMTCSLMELASALHNRLG